MSDTMRRIRSYKSGTMTRAASQPFQARMLTYLVQPRKHPIRKKRKEMNPR